MFTRQEKLTEGVLFTRSRANWAVFLSFRRGRNYPLKRKWLILTAYHGHKKIGKGRMLLPYSTIIGTGVPYPPYGRGTSRMGFIVARLVAMISSDDRVYRTSPI